LNVPHQDQDNENQEAEYQSGYQASENALGFYGHGI